MADEIDESAETFSDDAWCPYCDRLRRHVLSGGHRSPNNLLKTCGDPVCHAMAISVAKQARLAGEENELPAPRLSMCAGDIDFQNGFASQNLTFTDDYARLRT